MFALDMFLDGLYYEASLVFYISLGIWFCFVLLCCVIYRARYNQALPKKELIKLGIYSLFYIVIASPIITFCSICIIIIPFLIHYATKGYFKDLVKDYVFIYLPAIIIFLTGAILVYKP